MNRSVTALVIALLVGAFGAGYYTGDYYTTQNYRPQLSAANSQLTTAKSQLVTLQGKYDTLNSQNTGTVATPEQLYSPPSTDSQCPVTTCADSTCSASTGRGTCSYHGGEAY